MSRVLLARGASGDIVRALQSQLGFTGASLSSVYNTETFVAVSKFQKSQNIPQTGAVDSETWKLIMMIEEPTVEARILQVTGSFEGHGFTLAQGNYDGAGITWGIIGFTLKGGELGGIIQEIQLQNPDLVQQAFGTNTVQLMDMLAMPWKKQEEFANAQSLGANKVRLAEPWRTAFRVFGEFPEVQAAQLARSNKNYYQPALAAAMTRGLKTELGIALLFDIHVQNGGISAAAQKRINDSVAAHPIASEQDLRILIAHAVADSARVQYRDDVLSRKLTMATGTGKVHGGMYMLSNWGLDEFVA